MDGSDELGFENEIEISEHDHDTAFFSSEGITIVNNIQKHYN